jgi:hypothetical protein
MKFNKGNILSVLLFATIFPFFILGLAHSQDWAWQNPLPQGNDLTGVWGSSGSDVFAVGFGGTIVRYNGSAWATMTSGTTEKLTGVWGSSGSNVFAVGAGGTILRYDGSAWATMTSGTTRTLFGEWERSAGVQ